MSISDIKGHDISDALGMRKKTKVWWWHIVEVQYFPFLKKVHLWIPTDKNGSNNIFNTYTHYCSSFCLHFLSVLKHFYF